MDNEKIKVYCCTFDGCSKTFMERYGLTVHHREHTKPFGCGHCNKSFARKYDLKIHQRIHSNQSKSEKCAFCQMVFNDPANLRKHIKNVHQNKEKPKPYTCRSCHKQFHRKESLQKHFQTHMKAQDKTLHHCKQCDIFYSSKSNLNRHLKKFH